MWRTHSCVPRRDSELLKSWNQNDLTIGRGEEILAADNRGWTPIRKNCLVLSALTRHRHRPEHGGTFGNGGTVRFLGAPMRRVDLRRSESRHGTQKCVRHMWSKALSPA